MPPAHDIIWTAPAPLWPEATAAPLGAQAPALARPAILRFASDTFMDELVSTLERDPSRLGSLRAIYETWREPAPELAPPAPRPGVERRLITGRRLLPLSVATAPSAAETMLATLTRAAPERPPRLYQPAHQRFYLVAACLVCQIAGLPDRVIDQGAHERAGFVVRRLLPRDAAAARPDPLSWGTQWQAYAFDTSAHEVRWVEAPDNGLAPGEEVLPLFGLNYQAEDGRRRRLLSGLIPVARREAYMGARRGPPAGTPATDLAAEELAEAKGRLLTQLRVDVTLPAMALGELGARVEATVQADPPPGQPTPSASDRSALRTALLLDADDQVRQISWYILLDLSRYLATYLPQVRRALGAPFPSPALAGLEERPLSLAEGELIQALEEANLGARSLADALRAIESWREELEGATQEYTNRRGPGGALVNPPNPNVWPSFSFPLTGGDVWSLFADKGAGLSRLEELIGAALPDEAPARLPAPLEAARPAPDVGQPGWFVIQCVFTRPGCGALCPPVLSAPTTAFELASFFEPDAPARPIRIPMPLDTSPGGLRKFTKNTAFILSDQLACQRNRLGKLTLGDLVLSVLPWPFHKDLPADASECAQGSSGIGLICSLSIPIITICALILLLIIVSLFDIIFRWIPYFILCFPVPGLRGKRE